MSLISKKIAVVGSRAFTNYAQLDDTLKKFVNTEDIIVSGGAIGADSMAQRWAKENGHTIIIHHPNYARYGKGATFVRNRQIVEEAKLVIAFYAKERWRVGGTAHSVRVANELGITVMEIEEL
jgi:predicted Rossmann fold nucleotide-binding protein DprA/Smf involved in DNA uptake